jgi:hypothetical protein
MASVYIASTVASKTDTLINVRALGRGRFEARQGGRLTCVSAAPSCDATRKMLAAGADPNCTFVMRHEGSSVDALRGEIGVAAGLTVNEPNHGAIHLAPGRPFPSSAVEAPLRRPASTAIAIPNTVDAPARAR